MTTSVWVLVENADDSDSPPGVWIASDRDRAVSLFRELPHLNDEDIDEMVVELIRDGRTDDKEVGKFWVLKECEINNEVSPF